MSADSKLSLNFDDLCDNSGVAAFDGDDKHTITVNSSRADSPAVASPMAMRGMGLDLSLAMAPDKELRDRNGEIDIQEQDVLVIFELADGSQGEYEFKLGQTVEFLKSYVEEEYGIPMQEQELYYADEQRLMLNPMSLLDYYSGGHGGAGDVKGGLCSLDYFLFLKVS
mmetsp:Transcript_10918/g.17783  ORF Transcript_10918/g.17783 Transcript_10918/m.17783 type:complete len:168 (-) Transcript_10918:3620-4123(-)